VALTGFLAHSYGKDVAGGIIHDFQGLITFSVAFVLLLGEARLLGHVFRRWSPDGGSAPRTTEERA
jgi:hypothetical protein